MDRGEPVGPEHLNQAGTRQEEGVGILLLSPCFLLLCVCVCVIFFLIPRSNQEVIGLPKKESMENRLCQSSAPKNVAKMSIGLIGGGDGVRRDE